MRILYFTFAWLAFAAGIIGLLLPVVPTTPFMLLALWGFSRSSPRFHHWLYTHKWFGPPLQQWEEHRVIPPLAKYTALSFMTISLVYVSFFTTIEWWLKVIVFIFVAFVYWFLLTKPSYPPEK